jgi:hypothetical protein
VDKRSCRAERQHNQHDDEESHDPDHLQQREQSGTDRMRGPHICVFDGTRRGPAVYVDERAQANLLLLGVALGEVLLRERRADGEHLLGVLPRDLDGVNV